MPPDQTQQQNKLPAQSSGGILHIRTFADDLRRAQAASTTQEPHKERPVQAIPFISPAPRISEKTNAEKLQEELNRHVAPIKEKVSSPNTEPIGQTAATSSSAFDIREAAREATSSEGTIIQDRRVATTSLEDFFHNGLKSWWITTVTPLLNHKKTSIHMEIAPRAQEPLWDGIHSKPTSPIRTLANDTRLAQEGEHAPLPKLPSASWRRISEPRGNDASIPSATSEEIERYRATLRTLPKPSAPKDTRIPFKQPRMTRPPEVSVTANLISKDINHAVAPEQDARERLARLGKTREEPRTSRDIPFIPPAPAKEHVTAPIRTYRYDALSDIKSHNLSARDIAAKEAVRSEQGGVRFSEVRAQKPASPSALPSILLRLLGALLVCALMGGGGYYAYRTLYKNTNPVITIGIPSFFTPQHHTTIPATGDRTVLLSTLNDARSAADPEGITQFVITKTSQAAEDILDAQEILTILDPRAPGAFQRSIGGAIMFGSMGITHAPFLIMKTSSRETAFAGMRAWEEYMSADLAPFFGTPIRRSYDPQALTIDQARSAYFSPFLLQNHEGRVLVDEFGEQRIIYLLVDDLILITRDEDAMRTILEEVS